MMRSLSMLAFIALQQTIGPTAAAHAAKEAAKVPLINVTLPPGSLPVPILAVLLLGFFAIVMVAIVKAKGFKSYAVEFPTHSATVIVALGLLVMTIPVYLALIALGIPLPDGAGDVLTAECALAGVTVVGLGVKRFSSSEYNAGRAAVEAAKAGAAPTPLNIDTSNVNINQPGAGAQPAKPPAAAGGAPPPFKPIDFGPGVPRSDGGTEGDSEGAVG